MNTSTIKAEEILDRIERGEPIIYNQVVIDGDIDLSRIDLPLIHREPPDGFEQKSQAVSSRIQIINSEFNGRINFDYAFLQEDFDLRGSIFWGEARFKGTCFHGGAFFEASQFKTYATFRNAKFAKDVRFQGACFSAIANFGNALFEENASFGSVQFSKLCTNFGEAKFIGEGDFTEAEFSGTANFKLAIFDEAASFWRAKFVADANFQGSIFRSYASFLSSFFNGNADFRSSNFHEELNLEFAEFSGNAIFIGTQLMEKANFFRSQFKEVNFEDLVMQKGAEFVEASFGRSSFRGALIQGDISFDIASFLEEALFDHAVFGRLASFVGAQFKDAASIEHARFIGLANFQDVHFEKDVSFSNTNFEGDASFDSAQFGSKAFFRFVHFQKDGRFQGAQFIKTADFAHAEFKGNLILEDSRMHTMHFPDTTFGGQIFLRNADFTRLEVRWASMRDRLDYNGAAYLSLVKNFKNLEWFEDADNCYYDYRRKSQSAKRFLSSQGTRLYFNWSKLVDWLALVSCGYGVRPRYTIFVSISLIIIFALFYWGGKGIVVEPLKGPNLDLGFQENLTFLDNLYFSTMVFTAKTQVKWYPIGIYRFLAMLEALLGWLFLALFLVTLGRAMIR